MKLLSKITSSLKIKNSQVLHEKKAPASAHSFPKNDTKIEPPKEVKNTVPSKKQEVVAAVPKSKTIFVTIGIDFGTSFTKVCFSEGKSFHFVLFNGSKYKPSIIYYDHGNDRLYFVRPSNIDTEEILYFKYSIIEESLPKGRRLSKSGVSIKPEILCGVFYLACLINESKKYIGNYFLNIMKNINIEWSITMGVPIDNYESGNKNLYDKILHIANSLSNDFEKYSVDLPYIDKYYKEHEVMKIPKYGESRINTLPELYAESLAFLQNRNVANGVYALMDVGGGTVDLAVMLKENQNEFSIVSKDIRPLGIEIVSNGISACPKYVHEIKHDLKTNNQLSNLQYISIQKERTYKEKLRRCFAELVMDLKYKSGATNEAIRKQNGKLPVLICGGGTNHKWYEDGVLQNRENLKRILVEELKLEILPVEKLLPSNISVNHRLLIAQTLSQPIEYIPELHGFPWHFLPTKINPNNNTLETKDLDDIAKEIYGELL
jgi:hypothetical protein